MATQATYEIQKEKYHASAEQAGLLAQVKKHAQLQSELDRNIARQAAIQAQLKENQNEMRRKAALEEELFVQQHLVEQQVEISVQAFHSLSDVVATIARTATITLGFASLIFIRQHTDHTSRWLKYSSWSLGIAGVSLLTLCVFISFLALIDGTKLCFQGMRGLDDIIRAVKGMEECRLLTFRFFIAAFFIFQNLICVTLWVKFEENTEFSFSKDGGNFPKDIVAYGIAVTLFMWCVPTTRLAKAYWTLHRKDLKDHGKQEFVDNVVSGVEDLGQGDFIRGILPNKVRKQLESVEKRKRRREKWSDVQIRSGAYAGADALTNSPPSSPASRRHRADGDHPSPPPGSPRSPVQSSAFATQGALPPPPAPTYRSPTDTTNYFYAGPASRSASSGQTPHPRAFRSGSLGDA